ncbi:hypothetical protein KM043_014905 [Ampulex compressa]|nr:hypothetical protein KM043_014905 [Ampulex compressa]
MRLIRRLLIRAGCEDADTERRKRPGGDAMSILEEDPACPKGGNLNSDRFPRYVGTPQAVPGELEEMKIAARIGSGVRRVSGIGELCTGQSTNGNSPMVNCDGESTNVAFGMDAGPDGPGRPAIVGRALRSVEQRARVAGNYRRQKPGRERVKIEPRHGVHRAIYAKCIAPGFTGVRKRGRWGGTKRVPLSLAGGRSAKVEDYGHERCAIADWTGPLAASIGLTHPEELRSDCRD